MDKLRREQFQVVVAKPEDHSADDAEAVLTEAGFTFLTTAIGLEGLSTVATAKPNAIVLLGFSDDAKSWVLNFVEDNPTAPAVLAVASEDSLAHAPGWLYDAVDPARLSVALPHRLDRALLYSDMVRLSDSRSEKLGLSRAQIGMLSMVDVVTGLFNRRYFEKHLAESFATAKRYERLLTCLLVRIDNYPSLLSIYGSERSNDVLDTIALALSTVIRQADTAARIDDDLFGFLLPETPEEGASRLVQRLEERFERTEYPHKADVHISASHAQVSDDHLGGDDLLTEALESLPVRE